MFWLQFITLLLCIFIGARLGGVGLGVMGGVGMAILVFIFHLQPTALRVATRTVGLCATKHFGLQEHLPRRVRAV